MMKYNWELKLNCDKKYNMNQQEIEKLLELDIKSHEIKWIVEKVLVSMDIELYEASMMYIWVAYMKELNSVWENFDEDIKYVLIGRNDKSRISDFNIIQNLYKLGMFNNAVYNELKQNLNKRNNVAHMGNYDIGKKDIEESIKTFYEYVLPISEIHTNDELKEFIESFNSIYLDEIKSEDSIEELEEYQISRLIEVCIDIIKSNKQINEFMSHNIGYIIRSTWSLITPKEKYMIGDLYEYVINIGDIKTISIIRNILIEKEGMRFIPKHNREDIILDIINELKDVHYGFDNFYNEPIVARQLDKIKDIPNGEIKNIYISVNILCKIGNLYGYSVGADKYYTNMLDNISEDEWEFYVKKYLPKDNDILDVLEYNSKKSKVWARWIEIVEKYNLTKYNDDILNIHLHRINPNEL